MRWVEVLLILLVCFVVGGDPPPHENEAHYLCRLKHYWNPAWCAGDLFLESADAQLAFIWSLGWLTRLCSLTAVAWIGRFTAWTMFAWAWQRLSWQVVPKAWAAVISALLFVALNHYGQLAGEWIIGGVEAKCFAYVFVLLALYELVDERWNRAWLLLGGAAAFHPLVGGWSAIVCGGIFVWERVLRRHRVGAGSPSANFPAAISMLPGIAGGASIALLGIVPALLLTWNEPAEVVAEASQIYVFERLPHHLALLRLAPEEFTPHFVSHIALLLGLLILARLAARNASDRAAMRRLALFAYGAAGLAAIGFVIELSFWNEPLVAARLQRYYWYRLTDFAAPLAAALLLARLLLADRRTKPAWAAVGLAAALVLAGWFLVDVTRQRAAWFTPPADRRLRDPAAWQDVGRWIADHTEPTAKFLTPRTNQTFKWHAGRAEIVTRKDIPQDARSIVEWFHRYREIHLTDEMGREQIEPEPSLGHLGTERVLQLAEKYGFEYVVTEWRKPLWLPHVYPNVAYANGEYVVYRIPKRRAN